MSCSIKNHNPEYFFYQDLVDGIHRNKNLNSLESVVFNINVNFLHILMYFLHLTINISIHNK